MGLIRFLIIAICILYILRFMARLLLPLLFQSVIKKAQQQQQPDQPQEKPTGKISVDYVPPKKRSVVEDKGEFVEYEEVK